jgi:predicted DNA-binding transcriptional regulator AlpA
MVTREEVAKMLLIFQSENRKILEASETLSETISKSKKFTGSKFKPEHSQEFFSANEICARLSIARPTINKWQETRNFPLPVKIGNYCNRWRKTEVDSWIKENF